MKTIVITGPSGAGKTYLSNKLSSLYHDSIVIKTDSYYRDNIIMRFLSIILYDIYDRPLSIRKKEIRNTLRSINNKDGLISFLNYDFKRKKSWRSKKSINYKRNNQFLILEGIFSHRLDINYQDTINILCEEDKEICFKRRLKRDKLERGRNFGDVNKKFDKSWSLFYNNINKYLKGNEVISINPANKTSYEKLVSNLQIISKENK